MGSEDVSCVVCGKKMAYDDAYGVVEYADQACPVCCKECKLRFSQQPQSYVK